MAFSYIWHKLHLHGQKIAKLSFFVLLLISCQHTAFAQKKIKGDNKPNYDAKRIHYGFYLALPLTRYNIQHSEEYAQNLSNGGNMTVNPKVSPGFYTGLVLNVGLADYLDFRFVPGVGFYTRAIEYANLPPQPDATEPRTENVSLGTTTIELPFLLQYKSKRRSNYRMYFVGGIKPAIDLNSRKNDQPGEELRAENIDLALEYGVGLDMFYPYFKFAPELRFSHGLLNQLIPDENDYSRQLKRMTTHNVSFILFFE